MELALASDAIGLKISAGETVQLQGFPAEGNTNDVKQVVVNAENSELESKVFARDEVTSKERGKVADKGFKGRKDKDSITITGTVSVKGNVAVFSFLTACFSLSLSFSNWMPCRHCCKCYPSPGVVFVFIILSINIYFT